METPFDEYDQSDYSRRLHPFTREVRDLYQASVIAELNEPRKHDEDCPALTRRGRERCTCPTETMFFVGQRAIPSEDLPRVSVTPRFACLAELEEYCEGQIHKLRLAATVRS